MMEMVLQQKADWDGQGMSTIHNDWVKAKAACRPPVDFVPERSDEMPAQQNMYNIFENFHLLIADKRPDNLSDLKFEVFNIDNRICYTGFCDDFGPMSLGNIFEFCQILEDLLSRRQGKDIVLQTAESKESATNAAFLIGSYMIMKLNMSPDIVSLRMQAVQNKVVSYRDISPGEQKFHLQLADCWSGLWKAKSLDWIDFRPSGFDVNEYLQLDDPLNADLHEIIPGKVVAMRGPKDLAGGACFHDVLSSDRELVTRDFSPSYYVDILKQFNVQAVIRLNAPEYNAQSFLDHNIAVVDLCFQDCSVPPAHIMSKFLAIAEGLPGAIAVHCQAGLGRTGTLVALHLMKTFDFTAREAIGWLRIVRPGSVIGRQQQFLCDKEEVLRRAGERTRRQCQCDAAAAAAGEAPQGRPVEFGEVQRFVARTVAHVDRSIERLSAGRRAPGDSDGPAAGRGARRGSVGSVGESQVAPLPVPSPSPPASPSLASVSTGSADSDEEVAAHVAGAVVRRRAERTRTRMAAAAADTRRAGSV